MEAPNIWNAVISACVTIALAYIGYLTKKSLEKRDDSQQKVIDTHAEVLTEVVKKVDPQQKIVNPDELKVKPNAP